MDKHSNDPLFRSGHEACRFAFACSSQQYAMTSMARMMRGGLIGSGRGLVGLEGAAVAGTIKRHIEGLAQPYPFVIAARYELDPCKVVKCADALVPSVVSALGTGGHHRRMVQAIICRYFRVRGSSGSVIRLYDIGSQFGLSDEVMTRRWRAASDRLREMESRAQSLVDEALQQAGLIQ